MSTKENVSRHSVSDRSEQPCLIENLPPEIRRSLLYRLDYPELNVLVHASAVYHDQYLQDRRSLLSKLLTASLGSVTFDACTVCTSSQADHDDLCTRSDVTSFLESYQEHRFSQQYSVVPILTVDQIARAVKFHFGVVEPLLADYVCRAKSHIFLEEDRRTQDDQPLSDMERTRLLRALYRFQLYCNLFGRGRHNALQGHAIYIDILDQLQIFFCLFEPWEVEEIACIYNFAKETYIRVFESIKWDIDPDNPKFAGDGPPTPEGAFDLDDPFRYNNLLVGVILRGLEPLNSVHYQMYDRDHQRDHNHLVSTMQNNLYSLQGHFFEDGVLGETTQYRRRQLYPSDRDGKQSRSEPMPFRGDSLSDEQGLCPPNAWTLIWGEHYSNLFGQHIPDTVRRLGYVMWDASRLERTNAKKFIMQHWFDDSGTHDANDLI